MRNEEQRLVAQSEHKKNLEREAFLENIRAANEKRSVQQKKRNDEYETDLRKLESEKSDIEREQEDKKRQANNARLQQANILSDQAWEQSQRKKNSKNYPEMMDSSINKRAHEQFLKYNNPESLSRGSGLPGMSNSQPKQQNFAHVEQQKRLQEAQRDAQEDVPYYKKHGSSQKSPQKQYEEPIKAGDQDPYAAYLENEKREGRNDPEFNQMYEAYQELKQREQDELRLAKDQQSPSKYDQRYEEPQHYYKEEPQQQQPLRQVSSNQNDYYGGRQEEPSYYQQQQSQPTQTKPKSQYGYNPITGDGIDNKPQISGKKRQDNAQNTRPAPFGTFEEYGENQTRSYAKNKITQPVGHAYDPSQVYSVNKQRNRGAGYNILSG